MKPNLNLLIGLLSFLMTWSFVGVYRDAEFNEPRLFIKYKPSFKVEFYSPTGMSDLTIEDLPEPEKSEEIAYEEFVSNQYEFRQMTSFLAFPLIQLTLTFLSFSLIKSKWKNPNYWIQLPAHFLFCLIFGFVIAVLMIQFDKLLITLLFSILILGFNIWLRVLVSGFRKIPD
jgi:magnesium-transporting ATPase (P-type)